ncbi:unnamed protein product [Mytilus edulis]|uniref:DZIP3-like HEPN domain-containing protein n=1 Tax=Mytilus edulis TaxID=6550 RepID=A0A8S3SC55_MYTED|nr:unnamed protein product [Mytilus edulis]
MINNVRTNGYVNFDIPLIYKLVRNLNLVPSPTNGWDFHTPPAANEILPGDDIERIRRTRNEILHRGNAQLSDFDLTDYFTTFKAIAVRLEAYLGKPKEKSHQIVIEEWEEQNKLFIKTDAVDFVLESLKEKNCCTVIGISGIGKSATIHHVALFLRDTEGYRIIPIHSPSEIDKYFQRNRKQIFVIDDICGKYTVIQTEVEKWIKRNDSIQRVLNCNNIKVIASSRIQVFNEKQFKRLQLFTQRFCNLSSDIYCLSSQVKLQIARQYLPQAAVEQIKNDLDKYEFLPLMFALYKSLCKGNENFDVVKFFKNPFNIYTEEIDALYELLDKTKFCALFFLVIYNGYLDVSFFTNVESEQDRQTRQDFFEDCGIPRNTLRQRILEQLKSLVPLFVRSNNDLSGQVISFSAIHDKTFDFLCFYFGNKFQKSFLRFADSEMLYERTMLKSLISPDETTEELTILIADFNEDEYFKRIIEQWTSEKLASLFYSRQMYFETYRNKLIETLKRLPDEKCRELITIIIDVGESTVEFNYIDDGCSGSFPVTSLNLAFKNNFSDLAKYMLNFINDTKENHFSFLLLKACSSGLMDVVKMLIQKGSNVNFGDINGWTPLIVASEHGHHQIVKLLLKSKANARQTDTYGWTPFMRACGKGNADIVKTFIKNSVEINKKDKYGLTPFLLAIENGHLNVIEILLKKGADVNVSTESGETPLILSCNNDNTDIIRLLIEKGADVNVSDKKEKPLLYGHVNNNSDIVRLLIEKGADVNVSNENGETPLILSCQK